MSFASHPLVVGLASRCALGLALASGVGCSAASDGIDATQRAADASGSFQGTWSNAQGATGSASLVIEQDGLEATGTLLLDGNACVHTISITGRVDADGFSGDTQVGAMKVHFDGSAGLDEIVGVYEALERSPCEGERGSMRLRR